MSASEVILRVGAEGGDVTLHGTRTPKGWLFSRRVIDQTALLLDLEDAPATDERSEAVDSWPAALALMDRYPWHRLYPLAVHPEFKDMVFEAVVSRCEADGDAGRRTLSDWNELCGRGGPSSGEDR